MTSHHAWMIKGWLIAQDAPAEIMDAIGAVIGGMSVPFPASDVDGQGPPQAGESAIPGREAAMTAAGLSTADAAVHKRRTEWSPESRAAAAERLRARQAAGLMKRKGTSPPGEVDRLAASPMVSQETTSGR